MSSFISVVRRSVVCVLMMATATGCSRAESAPPLGSRASSATVAPADSPALAAASASMPVGTATAAATAAPPDTRSAPLPRAAAMITTINMTIAARSVKDASARLRDETSRVDGYVSNMSATGDGKDGTVAFTLRVPTPRVAAFRSALTSLGEIRGETERVEDVGGERADRRARLANARAEEKRILELLAQRTGTLSEVLAAERELARVRETIERFDAQAADLEGKIALATINVSLVPLYEPIAPPPVPSTWSRISQAGSNGVRYAGVVLMGVTIAIAEAGPTLLMMGLVIAGFVLAVRAAIRRTRRLDVHVDRA